MKTIVGFLGALMILLGPVTPAWAAIYYVSPLGTGTTCSEGAPCSLDTANGKVQPGDLVYMRGGNYATAINPARNGVAGSWIVYTNYPNEKPLTDMGAYLQGWTKCEVSDPLNQPDYNVFVYVAGWDGGVTYNLTFPHGHFGTAYQAIDGVDAIYKLPYSGPELIRIAEDDFDTNGRETIWFNKKDKNNAIGTRELFQIIRDGEYFQWKGYVYARTADKRDPDLSNVRGLLDGRVPIKLAGRQYIRVEGYNATNTDYFVNCEGANNIVIDRCTFRYATGYSGISFGTGAHHITIRNSVIEGVGSFDHHGADAITFENAHHILIDGNEIAWGGHGNLMVSKATYSIFRNNLIRDGASSMRLDSSGTEYNLIEGNRIVRTSPAWNLIYQHEADHPGITLSGKYTICRKNSIWDGPALNLNSRIISNVVSPSDNQRIYHNTVYDAKGEFITGILLNHYEANTSITRNVIINNIACAGHLNRTTPDDLHFSGDAQLGTNIIKNNIIGALGFVRSADLPIITSLNFIGVNPLITYYNSINPDFRLQTWSPAIDRGMFLTQTTSSGSGNRLPVADPYFFCDGYGLIPGDMIQLKDQTQTARITAVEYANAVLILDKSLTWTNGTGISLPYEGSSPDIGALEYTGAPGLGAPLAPRGLMVR